MKSTDIISILSYGLYGFTYLLIYHSYQLLNNEQKKKKPSELILNKVFKFMILTIIIVVIVGSFELIKMYVESNIKNTANITISEEMVSNCKNDLERIKTHSQLPNITIDDMKAGIDRYSNSCGIIIKVLEREFENE